MKIAEIAMKIKNASTILNLDEELAYIYELQKLKLEDISVNFENFAQILDHLSESHMGNGIFEIDKTSEGAIQQFAKWLKSIAVNLPGEKSSYLDSIARVFESRYCN